MWDRPGPGLEPVSLALAGGFLTTVPPGKSHMLLNDCDFYEIWEELLYFNLFSKRKGPWKFSNGKVS